MMNEQSHGAEPAEVVDDRWASDTIADFLRQVGLPYIALNPGASFRGLHDSLVNHLGDSDPSMLMCLHEEHAVALAHGYAKVTEEPLAVALHSNVGLMHASMALFNAWADRVPMLVIGAAGPMDAAKRRPWIDWIHTTADQAALVRSFIKWDDQPLSLEATVESLARAWDITRTPPHAPTYVVLDSDVQEQRLTSSVSLPTVSTGKFRDLPIPSQDSLHRASEVLGGAEQPVVLMGRVGRGDKAWDDRVRLVEALGAKVITDLKVGAAFPSSHPAHVAGPGFFLGSEAQRVLSQSDAVLALDWVDLAGTLAQAPTKSARTIVSATQDTQLHNGWSKDHQARPDVAITLPTTPDIAVEQLLEVVHIRPNSTRQADDFVSLPQAYDDDTRLNLGGLARVLRSQTAKLDVCLVRLPLGWDGDDWDFNHPLDFLGYDGGGGIGSGPGMLVGAALALRGKDRLPIAVLGDGDYLMGAQALWTAARYDIPLLAVVANNRSYFNDEVHQERVAHARGRDASLRWIGQRIDDPAPDLAALARAMGLEGIGPVTELDALPSAVNQALELLLAGRPTVLDVVVEAGYSTAMTTGLVRSAPVE